MLQASLFIKNGTSKSAADKYLASIKEDVDKALANPDVITEALGSLSAEEVTAKFGVAPAMAVSAIKDNNGLGLGYEKSYTIKSDIDAFLKEVQNLEATSEEIYYK